MTPSAAKVSSADARHVTSAKTSHVTSAKTSHVAAAEAAHVTAAEAAHVAAAHVASAATVSSAAATAGLCSGGKEAAGKHCTCQNHHHSCSHDILLILGGMVRHRADAGVSEKMPTSRWIGDKEACLPSPLNSGSLNRIE
jgi:hypothetical protein